MVGNMAVFRNKDDHIKPVKGNPNNPNCKIDGGVAVIMSLKAYQTEEETGSLDSWLADPVVIR
jgi:phage terminase large subunit-like protein